MDCIRQLDPSSIAAYVTGRSRPRADVNLSISGGRPVLSYASILISTGEPTCAGPHRWGVATGLSSLGCMVRQVPVADTKAESKTETLLQLNPIVGNRMTQVKQVLDTKLRRTLEDDMRAVTVLRANKLFTHALAAMFSSIDKMAWLTTLDHESEGKDFKAWVDTYFISSRSLPYTANDLWAARCGLLHTGAAESRDYRKNNANLIYYLVNHKRSDAEVMQIIDPYLQNQGIARSRVTLVQYHDLLIDYIDALGRFKDALQRDATLHAGAAEKAGLQLGFQVKD